ncbi:hypothetical protein WH5701_13560 [Synechococcus sp. WH 5701]|nr:hypothetical protein [Synechococcus sp. CCFWC 502]EAQ74624.1 hypothetical protein WH5701_13560 [Synechococcus sp. WH 5701]WFN58589.1 hypothetical protein N4320_12400 [Synechococcus sp. CCFWC 502]
MANPSRRRPRRRSSRSLNRPPSRGSGWLHGLSTLLTVASQGERLAAQERSSPAELSSSGRRLSQRLELGQRLLDPLPAPLRGGRWQDQVLWQALRWGGAGLILAWWLLR